MFKWNRILGLALVAVAVVFTSQLANVQAETNLRNHHAPDLAYFDYPLDTYSVRQGQVPFPPAGEISPILFPGVVSIEPNDSYIYAENQGTVYKISMASVANTDSVQTVDTLPQLLGTLELMRYDAITLEGLEIETFEMDGLPAVRVNDLPTGLNGVAAHILAVSRNQIFEIVVEPVMVNDENSEATETNRTVYETILSSIRFDIDDEARWE